MLPGDDPRIEFSWLPMGRRRVGKTTWRRMAEKERSWDGRVGRSLAKWLSTRARGKKSLKPCMCLLEEERKIPTRSIKRTRQNNLL